MQLRQTWLDSLQFYPEKATHLVNRPLEGRAVTIFGNGPSLTLAVARALEPYPFLLTNNSYLLLRPASVLVSLDRRWFEWHGAAVEAFGHKVVTATSPGQVIKFRGTVFNMEKDRENIVNLTPGYLAGSNSGHAAIMLALQMGATRIYLAGFDMGFVAGRAHWHEEHPVPSSEANYQQRFRPELEQLVTAMTPRGIRIASVTHTQAAIPAVSLEHAIKDLHHETYGVDYASAGTTLPI